MLIVLRIMHQLGYVVLNSETEVFLENNTEWSGEVLEKISENKIAVVGLINKALKESHL